VGGGGGGAEKARGTVEAFLPANLAIFNSPLASWQALGNEVYLPKPTQAFHPRPCRHGS
jgi:hypothetical protein